MIDHYPVLKKIRIRMTISPTNPLWPESRLVTCFRSSTVSLFLSFFFLHSELRILKIFKKTRLNQVLESERIID